MRRRVGAFSPKLAVDSAPSARENPRPMNKKSALLLLALAATLPTSASCQCSRAPQERRAETLAERSVRLPNGLVVDLVAGPCGDSAALVVLLGSGIDHDPAGRSGLAHLAARVLASSAAAGRAARTVEAGSDHTLYTVVVPADRLHDELDEVAAWMGQRAPTEADLTRARAQVLEGLAKQQSDPAMMALGFAEESVQPTRGDGKRRGVAAEVEKITLAELQAFWQAHFKPGNARLTVAGRFDADKLRARLEATFAALPAGTPPVPRPPSAASVRGNLVMGDAPTAVAVAVPAPAAADPLYPAFLVLAARLLAKPPQARTWEASYDPVRRPELLFLTGAVGQAEQPEPAAARIRAEAAAILARPPAPDDAARAKERFRFLLDPHDLDPKSCAADPRAFAAARARLGQLRPDGASLTPALGAISKEQLDEAAALFDPKRTAAVIAGGSLR
jgi:zinc protease